MLYPILINCFLSKIYSPTEVINYEFAFAISRAIVNFK